MVNSEAGSSSDAVRASGGEYQVFLNFRGPDTGHVFTDFLYHDLVDAGVRTFRDEEELRVGEVIGENLLRVINNSIIYIPILSQNYASNKWCLRELAHIVEIVSKSESHKSILPIFLHVEPVDIMLKTSRFSDALLEHEKNFPLEVEAWRKALAKVGEIKGWNVKKDQSQATIVKSVFEKVLEKLELKQKSVPKHLVGLDDQVKQLIEYLDVNHRNVQPIGIYGMGGIGSDAARALGAEYQVFLNFRESDTGCGFTDFLYHGLVDAGVHVFMDETELSVGEVIAANLLCAISNSMIYIPIFSQNYASSQWCLRELVHIIDNVSQSEGKKSILPIFFHVEPQDVKLKTLLYSKALLEHSKLFPEKVEAWRKALVKVDEIKGWIVRKDQRQAMIVKSVVERVSEILELKQKSVPEHLVRIDDWVKHLTDRDVRLIVIYGMGGIGKTTIAKVVFNKLTSHFGKCCSFLEDLRKSMSTEDGIVRLQEKLLSDIVDSVYAKGINDSEQGMIRIGQVLSTKKVLVVLDDADDKDHIKKLIGNNSLHSGSRIIITTRNKTILQGQEFKDEIIPYEMLKMDDALALELFCWHAFGKKFPSDDYHALSSEIVLRTGGLPLAVKMIGSLLNKKDKAFWEEAKIKFRNVPKVDFGEVEDWL